MFLENTKRQRKSFCRYWRREILCPTHFRTLKLLGSALFGVGEYRAVIKALEEGILMKSDYANSHYDCRCFV